MIQIKYKYEIFLPKRITFKKFLINIFFRLNISLDYNINIFLRLEFTLQNTSSLINFHYLKLSLEPEAKFSYLRSIYLRQIFTMFPQD